MFWSVMLYGFLYGLASVSAGRNRLGKIENKVDNITKTATSVNKLKPSYFLFHSNKPHQRMPQYDCLAASNGVCTKRNTARFELLLFKNKVNNNSQTWPLIRLTSLATFYSKTLLLKWVMPAKEYYKYEYEQNGKFQF